MTAREMFSELGYRKYIEFDDNDEVLEITYKSGCGDKVIFSIYFKKIELISVDFDCLEVLQAINKQVEELGWNER